MPRGALAAGEEKIARLIRAAQTSPKISQRIDAISLALMGTKYIGHTLVGGATQREVFVVRDDGFDCVTFCEVVLAAAIGPDVPRFEEALRQIRYHHGAVDWHQRNHYFADWCARNVENKVCRRVTVGEPVRIHKVVDSEPAAGRGEWTLEAMLKDTLLGNARQFATGDIIGFVSSQQNLDYFHTGFIVVGGTRRIVSPQRVAKPRPRDSAVDEKEFFAVNGREQARYRSAAGGDDGAIDDQGGVRLAVPTHTAVMPGLDRAASASDDANVDALTAGVRCTPHAGIAEVEARR